MSTHYKGYGQGQSDTLTRSVSKLRSNDIFLSLFQSKIKCWIVPFGTSCWWKVPLISLGPDSAELLICCFHRVSASTILQEHIESSLTYSWNNSAKILNNQKSTLRKGSKQKTRVSPYRFTLLCLWHTHLFKSRPDL